jgi:glycosyltransferase involved in cell wall biosynthesis
MEATEDQRAQAVRVCFVIENLLPAGTERWIVHLIERLDRRRVAPLLCLTDGRGEASRRLEPPDCPVLRLSLPNLKTVHTLAAARAFYRFLRDQHVDVVQVHHADPSYFGVPVARAAGVPVVVQTKYDTGYWLTGFDLWMHRRLRRWIDVTLANCQACRAAAIAQERAPPEGVLVIDNGIELRRLSAIPPLARDAWQSPLRVGMAANLRPIKDPHNLLVAAERLMGHSQPLTFHLAGDGPLRASLQREIERRGLGDRVVLHGHVADMPRFLQSLQMFVLCSRSEGLPHALLEAMAAGRAVVATAVGGNCELIEDGVSGLLVPPGDPAALAGAIARLAGDPALAVRLGAAARRSVADRFDLAAMAARFADFYQSAVRSAADKRLRRAAVRSMQPTPTWASAPTASPSTAPASREELPR